MEFKEECENKYKEDLKSEMERFKNIELSNMRMEENKKYLEKIEKIREEYESTYEKKYEEIKNMKEILNEKEKMIEKEQGKKSLENNELIISQLRKIREDNDQRISQYINEINKLNNEKNILEQTIEDLKENYDSQITKIKIDYMERLSTEKNILKEESEREKKILINNYTNKDNIIQNIVPNAQKRKNSFEDKNINSIYLKSSGMSKKMAEDFQNRRKKIEEIDEEQERLNNKIKYEFKNIMNDHPPIVVLNYEEIEKIKNNNEYMNNALIKDKNESQRKKSLNDNWNNNYINNKDIKRPKKNSKNNQSPSEFNKNKYSINNNILNNNKNINVNNSIGNTNNMG